MIFSSVLEISVCFLFLCIYIHVSWPEILGIFEKINYLEANIFIFIHKRKFTQKKHIEMYL